MDRFGIGFVDGSDKIRFDLIKRFELVTYFIFGCYFPAVRIWF